MKNELCITSLFRQRITKWEMQKRQAELTFTNEGEGDLDVYDQAIIVLRELKELAGEAGIDYTRNVVSCQECGDSGYCDIATCTNTSCPTCHGAK